MSPAPVPALFLCLPSPILCPQPISALFAHPMSPAPVPALFLCLSSPTLCPQPLSQLCLHIPCPQLMSQLCFCVCPFCAPRSYPSSVSVFAHPHSVPPAPVPALFASPMSPALVPALFLSFPTLCPQLLSQPCFSLCPSRAPSSVSLFPLALPRSELGCERGLSSDVSAWHRRCPAVPARLLRGC